MNRTSKISVMPLNRSEPHHLGVLFIQAVPLSTKKAFKVACARRGQTMRDVIIRMMRRYVDKVGQ